MRKRWIWMPLLAVGFAGFIAVGGLAVQQLWNWLLPALFDARRITFWQALGLLALTRILFGGFGSRGGYGGHRRGRKHWRGMTAEERERFSSAATDGADTAPSSF